MKSFLQSVHFNRARHPLLVVAVLGWETMAPGQEPSRAVQFARFRPLVIDADTETLEIELGLSRPVSNVVLETPDDQRIQFAPLQTGRRRNSAVLTASLEAASIRSRTRPDDVHRPFLGYLRVYERGPQPSLTLNLHGDVRGEEIPHVESRQFSRSVQATPHLVNVVSAEFLNSAATSVERIPTTQLQQAVCREFYNHFPDDFDFINLITSATFFANRHHRVIRNRIRGIGSRPVDSGRPYGSRARLAGISVFPIPSYFDAAAPAHQHELGHQWVNYINVSPFSEAAPHWPLSDLASGIMGYGAQSQGLQFNYQLREQGGDYLLVADREPKRYTDLSLYLMGLIDVTDIGDHIVFVNQNQRPGDGDRLAGPVTVITGEAISRMLGPRIPNAAQSQKTFRVATIIVSQEKLTPAEMSFYDYFAARGMEERPVATKMGFARSTALPFYLATNEKGRLDMTVLPHP